MARNKNKRKVRSNAKIQVRNFTKTYGAKTVVKDISFTASDGAITGFIGHNGAGKSTTIKAITGVIKPTAESKRAASAILFSVSCAPPLTGLIGIV